MGEITRSQTVCRVCASRKKACDKAMPRCGFCKKKNISCRYETPASRREGGRHRNYHPGKNFRVISNSPPLDKLQDDVSLDGIQILADSLSRTVPWSLPLIAHSVSTSPHQSVEENISQYTLQILQLINITPDGLGERFSRIFDPLLPIVSGDQFQEVLLKFKDRRKNPPIDHYLLLLSMLLASGLPDPQPDPQTKGSLDRTAIYTTTKALVAQAQVIVGASLHLVQTVFLLAACEHLAGRPEVAYVSLMSCIGMARLLEAEQMPMWAIAVMERIILCEIKSRQSLPLTELPNTHALTHQPLEDGVLQNPPEDTRGETGFDVQSPALSSLAVRNHRLRRQTQVISLVDRVLSLIGSPSFDIVNRHAEITQIDSEIHGFLGAVLANFWEQLESGRHTSPTVALTFRLLFVFHNAVLDALDTSSSSPSSSSVAAELTRHQMLKSWTALDSACCMVLDVARHRLTRQTTSALPICCYYNGRAAAEHVLKRRGSVVWEARQREVKSLVKSEEMYLRRWCFEGLGVGA